MNLAQLLALIEQGLTIFAAIAPAIEQSHPSGAGSTSKLQSGLTIANDAVQALKASAPAAASTPVSAAV